jgi:hypothetical protein
MTINSVALEIFNSIVDGEGGTVATNGFDLPETGFFVGGLVPPLVFESAEDANRPEALGAIQRFIADNVPTYVGWWTDSETGKVYVDATSWHWSKALATHAATSRGELAFYDMLEQRDIRIAYDES